MPVEHTQHGMGTRSWRHSMHVDNKEIRKMFSEPGFQDSKSGIPAQLSNADKMLKYLQRNPQR